MLRETFSFRRRALGGSELKIDLFVSVGNESLQVGGRAIESSKARTLLSTKGNLTTNLCLILYQRGGSHTEFDLL